MANRVRRLFDQFHPESYDISLEPDKKTMTFKGQVVITGQKTGRPSQRITLHAKDLKIVKAGLSFKAKAGSIDVKLARIVTHKSYDELRLQADTLLYPGKYRITLSFEGKITRPMNGIYPCFFKNNGHEETILATQLESHHAREVFPCIDEPEAKAIFSLMLASPSGETALSNTEAISVRKDGSRQISTFAPTPKMSPYLLAFVVGKLKSAENVTKSGVKVRAYATADHIKHTGFALDVAVACLEFYNDYFAIDYPLSKCDLVALPDFASGAMENWGLITFREQGLLVDKANTTLGMKQYVANVVAHELTHQWFGNLVTMRWWNDLWLNESFASLMSYVALDKLFPKWRLWVQFMVDEQAPALKLDSLEHTHPINVDIKHPDEIRTIFDGISYDKGDSVLYMLMCYIGPEAFRDGLRLYLARHAYSNTESSDLWKAWEEVAKQPISKFMDAWTKQPGYPILSVKAEDKGCSVQQDRFYINPSATKEDGLWPVPLFPSQPPESTLLSKDRLSIKRLDLKAPLVINHERKSFTRVIYDNRLLSELETAIAGGKLNELDRLAILADSFEAAKAGYQSTIKALELLNAYLGESSVVVWEIIASNLGAIRLVMDDEDLRRSMNPKLRKLVDKQYSRLGWDEEPGDSHFDKLLRPIILSLASASEDEKVLKEIGRRYNSKQIIYPDIRGVIYSTIARHGNKQDFNSLLNKHNTSTNSEERVSLAAALTNFKQPDLIDLALSKIKSDEVRLQDVPYWIGYVFSNRYAKDQAWEWLKTNWKWLKDHMGNDLSFYILPIYAARCYSDDNFIPEFRNFFNRHMNPSFVRPVNQAIETITWQAAWKKRDLKPLKQFYS